MNPLLTIYFYFNKIFRSNSCDFYKIKSWLFTLGVITLGTAISWGQGNEDFSNIPANNSAYSTRYWTGTDGVTWTATKARTDQTLNGRAICINTSGNVASPVYTGGIGNITLTTKRAFGGGSGTLSVKVNGAVVGTVPYSDSDQTSTITGVDISGSVTVVIENSSSDRVIIDDISWTPYVSGPSYDITFNPNGGTGTMPNQTIVSGTTANLNSNTFTRTGYVFAGWSTSASGAVVYADNDAYTMGGTDVTLYAQWDVYVGPCFSMNGPDFPNESGYTESGDPDSGGSPTNTIRLASNKNAGSISTTATGVTAGDITLKFRAKGWSASETVVTVTVNGTSQLVTSLSTSFDEVVLTFTSVPADPIIEFSTVAGKRVHIGNVEIICEPIVVCTPIASITSFLPNSGPAGTIITITGSGFTGTTDVKFGTVDATSFTIVDDNTITAKVPSGINVTETITVFDANNCEEVSSGNFLFSSENNGCGGTSANFTDLFISEIYDSYSGTLGYIELFNPTNAPINLGANDYEIYRFEDIGAGNTAPNHPSNTITLTGTVAPYETFVIRFGNKYDLTGEGCSSSSTPNHNQTYENGFNANDRFFLMKNGVKVDDVSAPNYTGYSITRNPDASAPSIASTSHPTAGWSYTNDETCSDIGNYDFTPLPTISITHPNDVHEFSTPASLSMSVTSTGGTNTVYQWYFYDPMTNSWMTVTPDNLPGSLTVSGANTENLVISGSAPNIDGINNYQFYCNILDETCEIPSNAALFTIDNPLPIELTSFSAICDDKNESLIQWTTATETNNDYFVIEKSTDGKEWNLVEEIQGKGNYNFPSNYSIKDRSTSNFVTYYRLTQVDFNGDTETFHPISLVCQATGVNFQVFPNPANDFTTVSLQGYNFQNATLDLRTIEGKLIQRNLVFENTNSIHLNVNLNGLSQGIYLLHWTDGNGEKEVRKIVVK